eukprot:scaffold29750_cov112-Isochrysis_galbana.AAC.4
MAPVGTGTPAYASNCSAVSGVAFGGGCTPYGRGAASHAGIPGGRSAGGGACGGHLSGRHSARAACSARATTWVRLGGWALRTRLGGGGGGSSTAALMAGLCIGGLSASSAHSLHERRPCRLHGGSSPYHPCWRAASRVPERNRYTTAAADCARAGADTVECARDTAERHDAVSESVHALRRARY